MSTFCRFSDWKGLRAALGVSQHDMARLLAMSDGGYKRMENHSIRPPREQTIDHLRYALLDPTIQQILARSGYPSPFPDDIRQAQELRQ